MSLHNNIFHKRSEINELVKELQRLFYFVNAKNNSKCTMVGRDVRKIEFEIESLGIAVVCNAFFVRQKRVHVKCMTDLTKKFTQNEPCKKKIKFL